MSEHSIALQVRYDNYNLHVYIYYFWQVSVCVFLEEEEALESGVKVTEQPRLSTKISSGLTTGIFLLFTLYGFFYFLFIILELHNFSVFLIAIV